MDLIAIFIGLPVFLVLSLPIGLFHLFTLFGLAYGAPVLLLLAGAYIAWQKKAVKVALMLTWTACLGQSLSFLSWIVSRQPIEEMLRTELWIGTPPVAISGFPWTALFIPPSPMGADKVPVEMWSAVFADHLFWFAIATIIAAVMVSTLKKMPSSHRAVTVFSIVAGLTLLWNIALFVLWFD